MINKKYLRIFLIVFSIIFCSCNYNITDKIDKAIIQDKFYIPSGYRRIESFTLFIRYNDFYFTQSVDSNTFGKYNKGDTIDIIIHSVYINNKLKRKDYHIFKENNKND